MEQLLKQPIIIDLTDKIRKYFGKNLLQFLFYTDGTDGESVFDENPEASVYITKITNNNPRKNTSSI
jgi:hypothetical protein